MKKKVIWTNSFLKDYKLAQKRNYDLKLLHEVVDLLASGEPLPKNCRDHKLGGKYIGLRECHIKPDWVLIYRIDDEEIELFLFRTGTHSDLF